MGNAKEAMHNAGETVSDKVGDDHSFSLYNSPLTIIELMG